MRYCTSKRVVLLFSLIALLFTQEELLPSLQQPRLRKNKNLPTTARIHEALRRVHCSRTFSTGRAHCATDNNARTRILINGQNNPYLYTSTRSATGQWCKVMSECDERDHHAPQEMCARYLRCTKHRKKKARLSWCKRHCVGFSNTCTRGRGDWNVSGGSQWTRSL